MGLRVGFVDFLKFALLGVVGVVASAGLCRSETNPWCLDCVPICKRRGQLVEIESMFTPFCVRWEEHWVRSWVLRQIPVGSAALKYSYGYCTIRHKILRGLCVICQLSSV